MMIRVQIPFHLRNLAAVEGELALDVSEPASLGAVLDALEQKFPTLRGTIRDQVTKQRRPFIRYFACEQDISLDSPDEPLPAAVVAGDEPLLVVGSIAGG